MDLTPERLAALGLRLFRGTTIAVVLLVASCVGAYAARNAERLDLTEDARAKAPGRFLFLDEGRVHYAQAGPESAPTVVLVHGFSVPMYIWDTTATRLQGEGFRVVRFDLLGRGFSDRPARDYDLALFVRQLRGVLDSLRLRDPVHVVGLSMGGRVTAAFAAAHPERVRSVTLIAPAFADPQEAPLITLVPGVGDYFFAVAGAPGLPASQLTDFVHPERFPEWAERYREQMSYRGFRAAILSTIRSGDGTSDAPIYGALGARGLPTLLLWGREDRTVPFARSDDVRRLVPTAEFVAVDSAAHLPHMEQGEVTHRALVAFLRRH
jgi:pimeloyl-ACP methyl ester carboxylesterase